MNKTLNNPIFHKSMDSEVAYSKQILKNRKCAVYFIGGQNNCANNLPN